MERKELDLFCFQKAAESGNKEAMKNVGIYYENGSAVEKIMLRL